MAPAAEVEEKAPKARTVHGVPVEAARWRSLRGAKLVVESERQQEAPVADEAAPVVDVGVASSESFWAAETRVLAETAEARAAVEREQRRLTYLRRMAH